MADEAIIVGEAWLSEHYFTTDAKSQSFQSRVLQRRKQWDDEDAEATLSVRARFTTARAQLETRMAGLEAGSTDPTVVTDLYAPLREILGYGGGGLHLTCEGGLQRVSLPGIAEGSPLALIDARPVDALEDLLQKDAPTLLTPHDVDENPKNSIQSVARLLSALFIEDEGPLFALVFAGHWMLVAERERWPEGRYLAIDMQLVADRNDTKRGGQTDRALTCLSAESLAPNAEGDVWW
ncbi:MAG: class I SAM-dependent DNA methyltransferase, partial [Salinibacterium sp.]|nr:class I SAM-dependent DNA methyltransferase [Salinibacterium sp.]